MKICIVGAAGKLGLYMVGHALEKGHEVVAVCRPGSVHKLAKFEDRITIIPGRTNNGETIRRAVSDCDGVLTVLVPWGRDQNATGTAEAVLRFARPDARLVFSCGWHISQDGRDQYTRKDLWIVRMFHWVGNLTRLFDLNDQVAACDRIFRSHRRWTVVRGSNLEEGESQGLPVWRDHVGDPLLESNLTRRIDFALFMVAALENDTLIQRSPAIVGCQTESARRLSGNSVPAVR